MSSHKTYLATGASSRHSAWLYRNSWLSRGICWRGQCTAVKHLCSNCATRYPGQILVIARGT